MNAPMTLPRWPTMRAHGPFAVHPNVAAKHQDAIAAAIIAAHGRRSGTAAPPSLTTETAAAAGDPEPQVQTEQPRPLTAAAQRLLSVLRRDRGTSTPDVARMLCISHDAAVMGLRRLRRDGRVSHTVVREGKSFVGYWRRKKDDDV